MQPATFQILSLKKQSELIKQLQNIHSEQKKIQKTQFPICPYCNCNIVQKNGKNKSIQRFKCKKCNLSFTTKTGTCLHYIHNTDKFQAYFKIMLKGHVSLKNIANQLHISTLTAFDWRHKILASLNNPNHQLSGLVELKQSAIPLSRKGIGVSKAKGLDKDLPKPPVRMIVAADYNEHNSLAYSILRIGNWMVPDIIDYVKLHVHPDSVIISPASNSMVAVKQTGKFGLTVFSKKQNPHKLDVKKSGKYHSDFKKLIFAKARGVSSKYLHLYANWAALLSVGINKESIQNVLTHSLANHFAWTDFTNRENYYKQFLENRSETNHIKTCNRIWKTVEQRPIIKEFLR